MIAQDIIPLIQDLIVPTLSMKTKESTIISAINLGLIELYNKFNLSVKTELIKTNTDTSVYSLRNTDVSLVIGVYDENSKELVPETVQGSPYDYKQLNWNTYMFANPKMERVMFVYKASPPKIQKANDYIDIPDSMISALLDYVGYRCHSITNQDNGNQAQVFLQRFNDSCQWLLHEGYRVDLFPAERSIADKGFK